MLVMFLDGGDLVRRRDEIAARGREARDWLTHDERAREVARRGREARDWLSHDERGRIVGLIVVSVAVSIALSLLATAIVRTIKRRRAGEAAKQAVGPGATDAVGAPDDVDRVPEGSGDAAIGVPELGEAAAAPPGEA